MDPKAVEKWLRLDHVPGLFEDMMTALQGRDRVSVEECEALLRDWAAAHGFEKLGPIVHPIRVALTGSTVGPGLFELMALLGPRRMCHRLQEARKIA